MNICQLSTSDTSRVVYSPAVADTDEGVLEQ